MTTAATPRGKMVSGTFFPAPREKWCLTPFSIPGPQGAPVTRWRTAPGKHAAVPEVHSYPRSRDRERPGTAATERHGRSSRVSRERGYECVSGTDYWHRRGTGAAPARHRHGTATAP